MSQPSAPRWNLICAAKAWDVHGDSLNAVNKRIHDGVLPSQLVSRADNYLLHLRALFPYAVDWNFSRILEIGSGVGFIMEAIERKTRGNKDRQIIGLDISETMIAMASEQLANNPYHKSGEISFCLYDGVTIPQEDASLDFIYSFATLQHIPKPFVYNLLFEIKRILKPDAHAILHFTPFSHLPEQERTFPWRQEVEQQIEALAGKHWHHFYSREELTAVFHQTGFKHVDVADGYFVCARSNPHYPVYARRRIWERMIEKLARLRAPSSDLRTHHQQISVR